MLKLLLLSILVGISLLSVSCGSTQEIEIEENYDAPCKHYLYVKENLKVDPDTYETYYENDYYDFSIGNYPISSDKKVFKDSEGRYYYFVDDCTLSH